MDIKPLTAGELQRLDNLGQGDIDWLKARTRALSAELRKLQNNEYAINEEHRKIQDEKQDITNRLNKLQEESNEKN